MTCTCKRTTFAVGARTWHIVLTCERHYLPEAQLPDWDGDEERYAAPRCSGVFALQFGNCNHPRRVVRVNGHSRMGEALEETMLHEMSHATIEALCDEGQKWAHNEAAANVMAQVMSQVPALLVWLRQAHEQMVKDA